jgi:hypothetical protein
MGADDPVARGQQTQGHQRSDAQPAAREDQSLRELREGVGPTGGMDDRNDIDIGI